MEGLRKYVGTYRVLAEYDRATNDWIRDEFGNLEESFGDFYIPLKDNIGRILEYDKNVCIIYITDNSDIFLKLKNIQKKNPVKGLSALGGSKDGFIYVYYKDLPKYFEVIQPITKNKTLDPFDYRNLPNPFKLPKKAETQYKSLAEKINEKGNFRLADLSRKFILTNCATAIQDFRKTGLTYVGFIYQNGKWDEFLNFLTKNT